MPRVRPESGMGRNARLGQQVSISRGPVYGDRVTIPAGIGADRVWTGGQVRKNSD